MNEKYLIYNLKNKNINAKLPKRLGSAILKGYVNSVERDVLNSRVLLTVDNHIYAFREPKHIHLDEDEIIFIYGDTSKHDLRDDELLEQLKNGEPIDSVLKNATSDEIYTVSFKFESKIPVYLKNKKAKK